MAIRLELKDEKADKFWQAHHQGEEVFLHWGRCGTQGQRKHKRFSSETAAASYLAKQVQTKLKKGYLEVEPPELQSVLGDLGDQAGVQTAESCDTTAPLKAQSEPPVLWSAQLKKQKVLSDAQGILPPPAENAAQAWKNFAREARSDLMGCQCDESIAERFQHIQKLALKPHPPETWPEDGAWLLSFAQGRSLMDYLYYSQGLSACVRQFSLSLKSRVASRYQERAWCAHFELSEQSLCRDALGNWAPFLALYQWLEKERDAGHFVLLETLQEEFSALRAEMDLLGRISLSLLLQKPAWLREDTEAWLKTENAELEYVFGSLPRPQEHEKLVSQSGWLLWALNADPEQNQRFIQRYQSLGKHYEQPWVSELLMSWFVWSLKILGPDAAPFLGFMAEHAKRVGERKLAAECLAAIHSLTARQTLMALRQDKSLAALVNKALEATPLLTLQAILRQLTVSPRGQLAPQFLAEWALRSDWDRLRAQLHGEEQQILSQHWQAKKTLPTAALPPLDFSASFPALPQSEPVVIDRAIHWWPEDQPETLEGYIYSKPPLSPVKDPERRQALLKKLSGKSKVFLDELDRLSQGAALELWNGLSEKQHKMWYRPEEQQLLELLKRLGPESLPGWFNYTRARKLTGLAILARFTASEVAPVILGHLNSKAPLRQVAKRWLQYHPNSALAGLWNQALLGNQKQKHEACTLLGSLLAQGFLPQFKALFPERKMQSFAQELAAILPPVPAFDQDIPWRRLARPLIDSGTAVDDAGLRLLVALLVHSPLALPHPALAQLKAQLDSVSLARFADSLFELWLHQGCPNDAEWMFLALAHLGDVHSVRLMVPHILRWPGERAYQRALVGLEILELMGADFALSALEQIRVQARYPSLKEASTASLHALALRQGLSREQLADRLVPDLGLNADGRLPLSNGKSSLEFGLKEDATPAIWHVEKQKWTKTLPAAFKAHAQLWKNFRQDLRKQVKLQLLRLESALCTQRCWALQEARQLIWGHPLLKLLCRDLIWGVWQKDETHTRPYSSSGVLNSEGQLIDVNGNEVQFSSDCHIVLAHPVYLPEREAWQERLQGASPWIEQLTRGVYFPRPLEWSGQDFVELPSQAVPSRFIQELLAGRWQTPSHGDGELELSLDEELTAYLYTDVRSYALREVEQVHIYGLQVVRQPYVGLPPATLPLHHYSELRRELMRLEQN